MNAEILIKRKLMENLKNVEVLNNSNLHRNHISSPKTGNSHFKIIIHDRELHNLSRVQSHQNLQMLIRRDEKFYSCFRNRNY